MEQVRSFVAIELSDQIKEKLRHVQALLKSRGIADQVRWVRQEGMHVTLKFLGDVPVDRIGEITVSIKQGSEGVGPFTLSLAGLGCFPSARRPTVIWVGLLGNTKTLALLQQRIEDNLAVLGFAPEKRKYTPHLTLGRVGKRVGAKERAKLGTLIETEAVDALGEMEVHGVSLMKSVLSPTGAQYGRLAVVQLEG